MYKINKFLIVALAAICIQTTAHADILSLTVTNNSTNTVWVGAMNISNIQIVTGNTPTTNALLTFYDNAVGSNVYVRAAYTNFTEIATNVTSIITNSVGDLMTNTYPGVWALAVTNAIVTNSPLPVIYSAVPVQNTSLTKQVFIITTKGLAIASVGTTNASVTAIITYTLPY